MPVPPPPAPPPPPTLALVSFTGGGCTACTVLSCCLSCWKRHAARWQGWVWYLGKVFLHFIYSWLILQEGLLLPFPVSAHAHVTSHIHSPSSSSSHIGGLIWCRDPGWRGTARLSQRNWSLALPLLFSSHVLSPSPLFHFNTYMT